jgi:hypothetical protein
VMTQEETKNLPRTVLTSKVVNPFTRALTPPFIGRRRYFYIPKTPSSSKNIPNVNIYMNVFFISYIYKPATSSHAKPRLFETTSLTLLLTGSWISRSGNLHAPWLPNLTFSRFPNFTDSRSSWLCRFMASGRVRGSEASQVQDSISSRVRDFTASHVQDSRSSRVRDSKTSQVQDPRSSRVRDSETSQVQDSRSSRVLCPWKLISRTSLTSTFRGWQVFLNSPTICKLPIKDHKIYTQPCVLF